MDVPDSGHALWYRTSRPLGKVRRRVLDLRIPSSSYRDFVVGGRRLDLSHNESARLAVDCLLNRDLEGYERVLKADGEVDFLSQTEKSYILENGTDINTDGAGEPDEEDKDFESLSADGLCSAPSAVTDSTVDCLDQSGPQDVKWIPGSANDQSIGVFFQSDSRAAGMKDLLRQLIRKANTALAIVMDSFSDVELLCDLLEASRKRSVSVHLLLDHQDLNTFVSMWQDLKLDGKNFPKMSVRSVRGQTYRAKTGRKLTGQIAESFVITDWTEVLTGSYSFTWLSWQVHRSVAVLLKGSSVTPFHHEFQRLYSDSEPVLGFAALVTLPQTVCPASRDGAVSSRGRSDQSKTAALWTWLEEAESADTNPATAVWGTGRSALASGPERDPPAAGPELQSAERPVSGSNLLAERSRRDQSHLLYPSAQQQMQPIASHRFLHSSQNQTKIFFQEPRWQDQAPRQCQPPFHPHSITNPPYSEPPAAAAGAHLRPHLQADSKLFPPGGRLQIHQLPTSYQQMNCPPWLNRTPQSHQASGPRAVARYNSFGGTGAREGLDWRSPQRSLQSSAGTPLGRSRSMAQRGTTGLF